MMKKRLLAFMCGFCFVAGASSSCKVQGIALGHIMSGKVSCDKQTVPVMMVNGPVSIRGGQYGDVHIHGSLDARKATFIDRLSVFGSVLLRDDVVKAKMNVVGMLHCNYSKMSHVLNLVSSRGDFNGCQLKSIVMSNHDKSKKSSIYINTKSVVDGDIVFQDTPGVVYLSAGSRIKGQVKNGYITQLIA